MSFTADSEEGPIPTYKYGMVRVRIYAGTDGSYGSLIETQTVDVYSSPTASATITFSATTGMVYRATFETTYPTDGAGSVSFSFTDDYSQFGQRFVFFNSSNNPESYSGYNQGQLTVGNLETEALYHWAGMSSATGGGELIPLSSKVSFVRENGSTISNVGMVMSTWTTASELKILDENLNTYVLRTSDWFKSLSGTLTMISASDSVVSATITKKNATSTLGTALDLWYEGWFRDLHYNNIYNDSALKLKENIVPFDKNALSIIKGTDIVEYNYKSDVEKKRKIGFIADFTPAELSGKDHDRMELDSCVAVLIKAVQELNDRLAKLEDKDK